jgi:N utilization substance protein A
MNLVEIFKDFSSGKSIDSPTMVRVLEDVFRTLIKKKFTTDDNFNIIVNANRGDLELWRVREIVPDGEVTDELSEISYSEALAVDDDYEVGEECYQQLFLEDFGRRSIMAARQTLISRIMDLEKDELYKQYTERQGELVLCEVQQILKREILVIDDANGRELVLPRVETIRGDYFRKGDMVRGIIKEVEMRNNNNPVVIVSRTDERFLAKLMEQEVPEIEDGLITIKGIVRIPGERAKVSVESYDDRIDPVGACVGMKGSRIHGIVRELNQENIDVIPYTSNTSLYIQRSLTPARVSQIDLDIEGRRAKVYLEPDQVSLAIGKGGTNIKLASRLVGFEIDVYRNNEVEIDDVDLEEFKDEIEMWVLESFKSIGCDTARSVLELNVDELIRRTDLEEETVRNVVAVLAAEFDDVDGAVPSKVAVPKVAVEAPGAETPTAKVPTVEVPAAEVPETAQDIKPTETAVPETRAEEGEMENPVDEAFVEAVEKAAAPEEE